MSRLVQLVRWTLDIYISARIDVGRKKKSRSIAMRASHSMPNRQSVAATSITGEVVLRLGVRLGVGLVGICGGAKYGAAAGYWAGADADLWLDSLCYVQNRARRFEGRSEAVPVSTRLELLAPKRYLETSSRDRQLQRRGWILGTGRQTKTLRRPRVRTMSPRLTAIVLGAVAARRAQALLSPRVLPRLQRPPPPPSSSFSSSSSSPSSALAWRRRASAAHMATATPTDLELPPLPPPGSQPRVFDCIVVGAGPSGLCMAAEAAEQGLDVAVVDPKINDPWPNNYGVWMDEIQPLGHEDCIDKIWWGSGWGWVEGTRAAGVVAHAPTRTHPRTRTHTHSGRRAS